MPSGLIVRRRSSGEQTVLPAGGLGLGGTMRLHWSLGDKQRKRGDKLYWRTSCGKWLRLHQCAPWGKQVTCKKCRAYMDKVAAS